MSGREAPVKGSSTPIEADFAQVPVPPQGAEGEAQSGEGGAPVAPDEVAVIEFLDPSARPKEIAFAFPFMWGGREWRGVTARRMTLAEVIKVFETAPSDASGKTDFIHFFAAMTGLPAAVIRALEADDQAALREGCLPFLPRSISGSGSKSTDETRDA